MMRSTLGNVNLLSLLVAISWIPLSNAFLHNYNVEASSGKPKTSIVRRNSNLFAASESASAIIDDGDFSVRDSWSLLVLGDLHMEADMSSHNQAREDCLTALKDLSLLPCPPAGSEGSEGSRKTVKDIIQDLEDCRASDLSANQLEMLLAKKQQGDLMKCYMTSLGDLGRKEILNEQGDPGTTKSFKDAKAFFDGFEIPYDVVTGNHDLEGLDEFKTDQDNLLAFQQCFNKQTPYFSRQIGEKTLLLGLSTTRFRDSPYSSHECHVPDNQVEWFIDMVQSHPAEDGWKILVFSHAPIMGSGLRVLQNVHVVNGCAWLNHCCERTRKMFIQTVQSNPQIKLWFSGHFHLSHDYEDSISTSSIGSCAFVQVGVMGPVSSRDSRRQTRLIRGCSDRIEIYSVNHHQRRENNGKATVRLDAHIDLVNNKIKFDHGNEDFDHQEWFQAYVPREEDGCYIETPDGSIGTGEAVDSKVCWWHMADGAVLGLHQGQLVEYDPETLSPLGVVVQKKDLGHDREVLVVENGSALVLVDQNNTENIEVIHPNDDGSYWRKVQRNKRVRLEEKAREAVAKSWMAKSNN